jgi:hypothetical protein
MTWNQQKKKKNYDNFWLGFIPGLILPAIFNVIIFKAKWTTEQPLLEAMWKLAEKGFMGKDLMAALLPSLILLIFFSAIKKEKACMGTFVGLTPFLILAFIFI